MELFLFAMRIIIGCLFFSSAISKFNNMIEHIVIVRKYKILPSKMVKTFSYVEASLELLASLLLIFGYKIDIAGLVLISLLASYTLAIIINLLKGNVHITCGCGGVIGDQKLSWFLPIRNLIFGLGIIFLISRENSLLSLDSIIANQHTSLNYMDIFSVLISSMLFLILYSTISTLISIKSLFEMILKSAGERGINNT